MWFLLLAMLLQFQLNRPMLEAEDARVEQPDVLVAGLKNSDVRVQQQAVRAIGRLERAPLADSIRPLLASPDAAVRKETVNALGQMNAPFDAAGLISAEKDASVRSVIDDTAWPWRESPEGIEGILAAGLKEPDPSARYGAAKGMESLFRTHRTLKPAAQTIAALRQAFRDDTDSGLRELVLLTLNAAGDV